MAVQSQERAETRPRTFFSTMGRVLCHVEIALAMQKNAVLGAMFGYLTSCVLLEHFGSPRSLDEKLQAFRLTWTLVFFMMICWAGWRIEKGYRKLETKTDLEMHYFNVAYRTGNFQKAQGHRDQLETLYADLDSGEFLRWK